QCLVSSQERFDGAPQPGPEFNLTRDGALCDLSGEPGVENQSIRNFDGLTHATTVAKCYPLSNRQTSFAKWSQSPVLPRTRRAYETHLSAGSTAVILMLDRNCGRKLLPSPAVCCLPLANFKPALSPFLSRTLFLASLMTQWMFCIDRAFV